jgi:alanyl-tRNA synthetase
VSVQEENVKLKKQVEQLIRDKARIKTELTQQIQEINGVQFLAVQVDLNPEGAKDLAYDLGN